MCQYDPFLIYFIIVGVSISLNMTDFLQRLNLVGVEANKGKTNKIDSI